MTYIQTSSTRRTAKILSEFHPVSHTAVWKWIKKFKEKLPISTEKKRSLVDAVSSSFKQRIKISFCSITAKKSYKKLESVLQTVHALLQPLEVVKLRRLLDKTCHFISEIWQKDLQKFLLENFLKILLFKSTPWIHSKEVMFCQFYRVPSGFFWQIIVIDPQFDWVFENVQAFRDFAVFPVNLGLPFLRVKKRSLYVISSFLWFFAWTRQLNPTSGDCSTTKQFAK